MEISDSGGHRLDPGVVEVCLEQRRDPVGRAAEIGRNIDPEVIKLAEKIEPAATEIYAVVEVRKLSIGVRVLEEAAYVELDETTDSERQSAIRGGDGWSPVGHADL